MIEPASAPPRLPPGPSGLPFLGSWLSLLREDFLTSLTSRQQQYGDIVRSKIASNEQLLVNDPEAVRHVLQHNAKNYVKGPSYALLEMVVGQGLLTSEGDRWFKHRKLIQPAFHRQQIDRLGDIVVKRTTALADRWEREKPSEVDLSAAMMALTFEIVGEALFSDDVGSEAGEVADAIAHALSLFDRFIAIALLLPKGRRLPKLPLFGLGRVIERLDKLVMDIIERRRRSGKHGEDLLGMLMAARDEDGSSFDDDQLRAEALTLILAGHETTANALSWAFVALHDNPSVEAALTQEIDSALRGERPSSASLAALPYSERVISETLRLYPPAWIVTRRALGPDTIGGYDISADTIVQIAPYTLHRHEAYWEDPLRFDPDRFLPERSAGRSPWVYIPFGGGPRICIGKAFAVTEARLVLATLLQRFRFPLVAGHPVEPHATVTLRPKHGIRAGVVRRGS